MCGEKWNNIRVNREEEADGLFPSLMAALNLITRLDLFGQSNRTRLHKPLEPATKEQFAWYTLPPNGIHSNRSRTMLSGLGDEWGCTRRLETSSQRQSNAFAQQQIESSNMHVSSTPLK